MVPTRGLSSINHVGREGQEILSIKTKLGIILCSWLLIRPIRKSLDKMYIN
jgi:hypothetical protein